MTAAHSLSDGDAVAQARRVFLVGNGLPARWAGRDRFVVLETGFDFGHNFLAVWDAWQRDPQRCRQLVFVSIDSQPPQHADLQQAHHQSTLPQKEHLGQLAQALLAAWPVLTPNLHSLDFDGGQVRLLLALGDLAALLPQLSLQADAFCLGGVAPTRSPATWDPRLVKALGRRAAPDATAACADNSPTLRHSLTSAGFTVAAAQAGDGRPTVMQARYAPRHALRAAPVRPARREAVVVGAGLAGAAVARALADERWQVSVVDRQQQPAAETSGNPGGLFHGTVHADDGPHARLLRAAALHTERLLRPLIDSGLLPGQLQGLLRLDTRPLAEMQAVLDRLQLPSTWVQALDAAAASTLAGVPLRDAAWFYPGGGWVAPAALVAHWLRGLRFVGGCAVQSLQRSGDVWQLFDAAGTLLAEAPVLVLANAGDAARLLGDAAADWPLQRLRGQVSGWHSGGTPLLRPVAGDGYALPLAGGGLLCGASSQADDDDGLLRDSDHLQNFARLQRLTGLQPPADRAIWTGRVGWRIAADDRLPIAGPVPVQDPGPRRDQARLWPRVPGLFVCTALGGRGITLAPLLGRLVAAQVAGGPLPLEQDLVDAIDPVRWRVRAARRASARGVQA